MDESVLAKYKEMKGALASLSTDESVGPMQESLTKRKGTITVIAEYKRKLSAASGYIATDSGSGDGSDTLSIFQPQIMSPLFREYGASAVAIMADERMGGCNYDDINTIYNEQQTAKGDMPGPVPVINSDLIVDEVQIARSAVLGCEAVVLNSEVLGDKLEMFCQCVKAAGMESIVSVSTAEEAQNAVNVGARIIYVANAGENDSVDDKIAVISSIEKPNEDAQICTIANIMANQNKALEEVEESWLCRDAGFNAVWASDALYKLGNDPVEHAGAIISSMKAKSSVKYASARAKSGKGEGAREYLGDILM